MANISNRDYILCSSNVTEALFTISKCEYSVSTCTFDFLTTAILCIRPVGAPAERTNAWAETFFLELALRFVRSRALLERKISGLSDLRELIETAAAKEAWHKKQRSAMSYLSSVVYQVHTAEQR